MKGKFNSLKDAVVYRAVADGHVDDWFGTPDGWWALIYDFYGHTCLVQETAHGIVRVIRAKNTTEAGRIIPKHYLKIWESYNCPMNEVPGY